MEHLCETYPKESILFLKRAICTTIVTGLVLTTPIIICIYVTWNSLAESDESLRFWSLIRILLFFIQIPLRYDVWNKLNKCDSGDSMDSDSDILVDILRSNSWKCTQIGSFIVSMWVCITIIFTITLKIIYIYDDDTYYYDDNKDDVISYYFCFEGYLSPCLLRWCYISIFIFLSHILFIIYWLRNVILIKQKNKYYNYTTNTTINTTNIICSICIDNQYNKQNKFIQLNQCLHHFHKTCIDEWFKKKIQCPLCLKNYDDKKPRNTDEMMMILRNRKCITPTSEAIDVLLQSPAHCGNKNNSLFYFMPN